MRRFTLNLVTAIPLRATPDPEAAALASLPIGSDGILLVPAPLVNPPTVSQFDSRAPQPRRPCT
ncbi:MAG: hypothetical protein ACRDV9_13160, partial [Acidimicrobiia bacterium]